MYKRYIVGIFCAFSLSATTLQEQQAIFATFKEIENANPKAFNTLAWHFLVGSKSTDLQNALSLVPREYLEEENSRFRLVYSAESIFKVIAVYSDHHGRYVFRSNGLRLDK